MNDKNIVLVGLGPHAKRIYIHFFKNNGITPKLVVELESKKEETIKYLNSKDLSNIDLFFLPDEYKDDENLSKEYSEKLLKILRDKNVTHMMISTEPKAHNMYLEFALLNDINVLSDKPITVSKNMCDIESIEKIKNQYYNLLDIYETSNSKCRILCQRQYHRGYNYIKALVKEIIETYKIPITYINIYHCDGKWMMPHDLDCENHPYKYGYGKLFHSGYHFIDLLSEFIKLNEYAPSSKHFNDISMYNQFFTPNDELSVINISDYHDLFSNQIIPDFYNKSDISFDKYGEKNFYSLLTFKNNEGRTITTANLNLLQHGFSRRGWIGTNEDHYKGNGRIRHEYMNIQIGPLINIQVHSYQSKEIKDKNCIEDETLTGGLEHFDIDIYRNSDVIGGKPYEKIKLKNLYENTDNNKILGYNEYAREEFLMSFLNNDSDIGDLKAQKLGIEILYNACESLKNYYLKIDKIQKINWKEGN